MERKVNYALVGLFVIALGAAWLVISLWLTLGDFRTQYTTYHVYMDESVSGLYMDAPVKYRGVEIGKVREIKLNPRVPDQVQLTLAIESSVPIKADTIAVLTVQGLTGIAFVDLTGGSLDAPLLAAQQGEEFPVITSGPSFFSRLDMSGTELIANLNVLTNRLVSMLDADGRESLRGILVNIRDITGAVASRKADLEQSVVNARLMLAQVDTTARAFEDTAAKVMSAVDTVDDMAGKISATTEVITEYVHGSGTGIQDFTQQTLPELGALISELRELTQSLNGISRKLEEDPRILLFGHELVAPGPGE
jgi:phospholipid/cholesterol/gamma-HCH transport system substrate-binding protein